MRGQTFVIPNQQQSLYDLTLKHLHIELSSCLQVLFCVQIMERQLPTIGQLERTVSQNILKLYREELEHQPQKVISKFSDNHLSIVIEDSLTTMEKTLVDRDGANKTIKNFNLAISNLLKSKLKTTLEEVLEIKVNDVLFDCNINTKRTGVIIILDQPPTVRIAKPNLKIAEDEGK